MAIGFICNSYYDELSYSLGEINKVIRQVLDDWNRESNDSEYVMQDGTIIYMGCDYVTV